MHLCAKTYTSTLTREALFISVVCSRTNFCDFMFYHRYIDLNRQRMVSSAEFLIHKIQPQWKQLRSLLLHKPYHPLQLKGTLLRLDQLYQELWAQNGRLAVECAGGNRHNHEALPIWKISLMLIGTTQLIESAAEAELLSFNFYNMQQISGVIATVGIVPGYFGSIVVHLCNMYVLERVLHVWMLLVYVLSQKS